MNTKAQYPLECDTQSCSSGQRGFTLIELLIAAVVFLVGIVGVMQLVPAAMKSNLQNRVDTTSVVLAQRELDQMTAQPLSLSTFTDADGNVCNLGNSATPSVVVGSPLVSYGNLVKINFNAAKVAGYNFAEFANPQNPTEGAYDVRWAVITQTSGVGAVSKRFVIGVQRRTGTVVLPAVSLDAWQQLVQ